MCERARNVAVIAAVEHELRPLCSRFGAALPEIRQRTGPTEAPDADVVFAVSGVGKAAAAITATGLVLDSPSALVVVGCAGAYPASGLEVGDVVVVVEEIFADEGSSGPEGFRSLEELGLPTGVTPSGAPIYNRVALEVPDERLWCDTLEPAAGGEFRVVMGTGATVSTCSGTPADAQRLAARWNPLVESMEGAAVALVAQRWGCPCVEIRGVSNRVGERQGWDIDRAARNAARLAAAWIDARLAASDPSAPEPDSRP